MQYIQQTWKNNVFDLYTKYVKNKNKTIKNTDKYIKHKNVNNRMSFFYDEKVGELEGYNYVLKIIYWILTSIIFVVFLFKKQYRNYKMFAFIFLIVTLPFMLPLFNNLVYSYMSHFIVDNFFIFIIFSATLLMTIMYFSSTYPFIQVESIGQAVSQISGNVINKLRELKNVITSNNNISKQLAYDIKTSSSNRAASGNPISNISRSVVNKLYELKNVITSNNNISKNLAHDIKTKM